MQYLRSYQSVLFCLVASATLLTACGSSSGDDVSCGPGTERSDGLCVPLVTCGPGTVQDNNRCVVEDGITCGAGTVDDGNGNCVPSDDPCGEDTVLDEESGQCVSASVCASGTVLVEGECVVEYDMVCGVGTSLDEESQACLPLCGAGEVYDATDGSCASECGPGTVFSDESGVCVSECSETEYYVDGVGCVHVPLCGPGSEADPESEDCEGFPFDELTLDTVCARAAVNSCAVQYECCNRYGFTRVNPSGFGFESDEAACVAVNTDVCERGVALFGIADAIKGDARPGDDFFGVSALRAAVAAGAVTVDEEALAAFDELFGPDQGCSLPLEEDELTEAVSLRIAFGLDPRLIEAVESLVEPALRAGDNCELARDLGVDACISGRCLPSGETYRCVSRIPATSFTGDGDPEPTEICSPGGDANQCVEDTQCALTFFGEGEDEVSYYLCVPPKTEGERCEGFAFENPCAEGLVCRADGREDATCRALGTEGDACSEVRSYETCADGFYCDRELAGVTDRCFAYRAEFESCDVDPQCTPGLVCRPPNDWEDSVSLPAFSCRQPVAAGVACAAEPFYASWCGPERFCSDAANTCEDDDDCAIEGLRVGNCRPAREIGEACDPCQSSENPFVGLTGCAQGDFCYIAGDEDGAPTPVCQDGLSVCDFGIREVAGICSDRL